MVRFVGAACSAGDGCVSAVTWHVCHRDISVALPGAASQPGVSCHVIASVAAHERATSHGISTGIRIARRLAQHFSGTGKW